MNYIILDENKRPGFYEIDVIGDRGLYEAEIIRLGYIKNNAFQKGLSEKDMDPNHLLHSFVDVFKKKVLENPDIDKRELSIAILHAMPKDSFNRQGFCPLFSEK